MGVFGYDRPVDLCYECYRKKGKIFEGKTKDSTESTISTFQEWLGSKGVAAWEEAIREGEADPFPNDLNGFVYWTSTSSCYRRYLKWFRETHL
tara:strand:+ start:1602 stop:1880 length:279 start_codon:yes stop_codon:yes gene_type:complete